jgi:hypothetical protein
VVSLCVFGEGAGGRLITFTEALHLSLVPFAACLWVYYDVSTTFSVSPRGCPPSGSAGMQQVIREAYSTNLALASFIFSSSTYFLEKHTEFTVYSIENSITFNETYFNASVVTLTRQRMHVTLHVKHFFSSAGHLRMLAIIGRNMYRPYFNIIGTLLHFAEFNPNFTYSVQNF